jgi:D-alanine-D-alanine ligase
MNIAVVFGGISPERNVSIAGGKAVCKAITELGHNVVPVDPAFGADGIVNLNDLKIVDSPPTSEELAAFDTRNYISCVNSSIFDNIDLAFLVLHGKNGEDGKMQALLELRGVKYTGSNVKSSAAAMDKLMTKLVLSSVNLPTPEWAPVRKDQHDDMEYFKEIIDGYGQKLVVKPVDEGSTVGITIIDKADQDKIHDAVLEAAKYSETVLIERFIEGREITVGIIGEEALPIVEIIPEGGYYDYEHKYTYGKTQYICPAEMPENVDEFIQTISLDAYKMLGCSGFARVDLRLDDEYQPFILEVNTIPGFTETSLVPKAAAAIDISFPELCSHIINIALDIDDEN